MESNARPGNQPQRLIAALGRPVEQDSIEDDAVSDRALRFPPADVTRDLVNQALTLADYRGLPRRLTPELLRGACASYFVEDQQD